MTADTLGIEVETDLMSLDTAETLLRQADISTFRVTRDASCEFPAFTSRGGKTILSKTKNSSKKVVGAEFVSVPMNLEDFKSSVRNLTGLLKTMGEPERSRRTSIHIHVGCKPTLNILKNSLKLFEKIEPMFYRLGGMGYEFRGIRNNSIYCRPITHPYGPPVIGSEDGGWYQLFNYEDLLNCEDMAQFWYIMGINTERAERYNPARYFGLNLFSLLLHGTLEFRYFNKTLNHQKINAIAALCQCITELVSGKLEVPNVVFSHGEDLERLAFLNRLILNNNKEHIMKDRDIYILESIITTSQPYKIEDRYIRSHLIDKYQLPSGFMRRYARTRVSREDTINSGFIDIHNIGASNFDFLDNIS